MSSGRSRVFAADLLKSLQALASEQHDAAAHVAGFRRDKDAESGTQNLLNQLVALHDSGKAAEGFQKPHTQVGSSQTFWRVSADRREPRRSAELLTTIPDWLRPPANFDPTQFVSPAVCGLSPKVSAEAPLVSTERLVAFLCTALRRHEEGADPDLPRLVNRMASAKALYPLPRVSQRRWPGRIYVVADFSAALTPFHGDFLHVLQALKRQFDRRMRLVCTRTGEPGRWVKAEHLSTDVPFDGSPVIVLGDAGALRSTAGLHQRWIDFGLRLEQAGARPLLLAPLPMRCLPDRLCEVFDVTLLDQGCALKRATRGVPEAVMGADVAGAQGLALLRSTLFGSSHVPWPLLRRLRRYLQQAGEPVDIGTEAELWRDSGVCVTSTACALMPEQVEAARAGFLALKQRAPTLVNGLVDIHLQALAQASPLVLAVYLSEVRHAGLVGDEYELQVTHGRNLLIQAARCLWQLPATHAEASLQGALAGFFGGLPDRQPGALGRGGEVLQTVWALSRIDELRSGALVCSAEVMTDRLAWLLPQKSTDPVKAGLLVSSIGGGSSGQVELRLLPISERESRLASALAVLDDASRVVVASRDAGSPDGGVLMKLGESLRLNGVAALVVSAGSQRVELESFLKPSWADSIRFDKGEWCAHLPEGRDLIWTPASWTEVDHDPETDVTRIVPWGPMKGCWWDAENRRQWCSPARTSWASKFGSDDLGHWAEFTINGRYGPVTQRLRWIHPGQFLMGSPKDEVDRSNNEAQHPVLLTQGYWLADTACTQALWEAVMGENPSHFKGDPNLPVENVSWNDISQVFLPRLNKRVPGLKMTLPTEAQWEYACRAGTTTPFSFEDQITSDQVNYDGNYPYRDGPKGAFRKKTVPVKSLPANSWGLHEMHGNVLEWCTDELAAYPESMAIDPNGPSAPQDKNEGSQLVLRGGGWFNYGRYCRSANRNAVQPHVRSYRAGFRLARGCVDQPDQPKKFGQPEDRGETPPDISQSPEGNR